MRARARLYKEHSYRIWSRVSNKSPHRQWISSSGKNHWRYSPMGAWPRRQQVSRAVREGGSLVERHSQVPWWREEGARGGPLPSTRDRNCEPRYLDEVAKSWRQEEAAREAA